MSEEKATKYKVGDRVKVVSGADGCAGLLGTVVKVKPNWTFQYDVLVDNDPGPDPMDPWPMAERELEPAPEQA